MVRTPDLVCGRSRVRFSPEARKLMRRFLHWEDTKARKGSGILGVNSQGEVVLGGTHQPGLCMTQPFAIWLLCMSPCHGVK